MVDGVDLYYIFTVFFYDKINSCQV